MNFKFSEKFEHQFLHVFRFGNMIPKSRGFVAMPVTSCIIDSCFNLSPSYQWRETKLFDLMTGTATKPWLSGNMLPNINTCDIGWSNFSEIVTLKLLQVTQFGSQNLSIYFNFVQCWESVVMLTFQTKRPCVVRL